MLGAALLLTCDSLRVLQAGECILTGAATDMKENGSSARRMATELSGSSLESTTSGSTEEAGRIINTE